MLKKQKSHFSPHSNNEIQISDDPNIPATGWALKIQEIFFRSNPDDPSAMYF